MAREWPLRPLGELVENFDGRRIPVKETDRQGGPYPYYGASGIVGHVDGYLFDGEYLLISEDGENLHTRKTPVSFLVRGRFWVNNHAHIVRANGKADTRFLMYALRATDIGGYLTGSTMPKLTQGNMDRIRLPAPARVEQQAIAHVLGTLDDKIELNRRMNETLETIARAIFKSWFVDFDPVHAKAEGRQPFGMNAETAALFPDSFEDSAFGPIPSGWRIGRLKEMASLSRDTVNPGASPNEIFQHYSIPAFDAGRWPEAETGSQIKSNKFLVPGDSALLSKLNPRLPRVWLPLVDDRQRSIASTEFLVVLARMPFTRTYLFGLFTSERFFEVFATLVTGTSSSHQRVRPEFLQEMDVAIPPQGCVESFSRIGATLHARISANLKESHALAAIRNALLPKLISGEIRVRAAEKFVRRNAV